MRTETELEATKQQLQLLQEELDETNRGVLALYAELDVQAEQLRIASQRSESKFLTIYSQAPSGIALVNDAGLVVDANPAMLKLLSRTFEEVVNHQLSGFAPSEWARSIDAFSAHTATAPIAQQLPMFRPDGSLVYLEWNVSAQIEPGTTMVVATDVSARIELEKQRIERLESERVARGEAEQINRMKDDFIAVLSHELRTPLNAILSWAHLLRKRGGTEETMKGIAAIERNGKTQGRMISDLLDMSRLNMGKLPMLFELIDPVEEITSAVNALRPLFEEKSVQVEIRTKPPYRAISADASRMQQVIWNLITNAIKFSAHGSKVVVALEEEALGLRVHVIDAGQGITADFLPFVFDRFSQSNAATNRQLGGLGLGLAIVKQLVEAHGGEVSVRSEGLGKGTTFELWLPTDTGQADRIALADTDSSRLEPIDQSHPLSGLKLLVVDDDADANTMLQIILRDRGATVSAASGVTEALELLKVAQPDLLISDIGMAGRDGYELIREVRRLEAELLGQGGEGQRLAAIALTSFAREQDKQQALRAGFDTHCAKPLSPLTLMQEILHLLASKTRLALKPP
ncbi:ATP-binding protein [Aquabacterium sp.]|uniref:hybrid sensor histidine kinase/response regulator n=1 Tax=Aquabacterium sp. TaxID=1872578 RepID=UPI003D6D4DC5